MRSTNTVSGVVAQTEQSSSSWVAEEAEADTEVVVVAEAIEETRQAISENQSNEEAEEAKEQKNRKNYHQ